MNLNSVLLPVPELDIIYWADLRILFSVPNMEHSGYPGTGGNCACALQVYGCN